MYFTEPYVGTVRKYHPSEGSDCPLPLEALRGCRVSVACAKVGSHKSSQGLVDWTWKASDPRNEDCGIQWIGETYFMEKSPVEVIPKAISPGAALLEEVYTISRGHLALPTPSATRTVQGLG